MARKNNRLPMDTMLAPIKDNDDRRDTPICPKYHWKTVFTSPWRAQVAIDDIDARSKRDRRPNRVTECPIEFGGCGYYHISEDVKH